MDPSEPIEHHGTVVLESVQVIVKARRGFHFICDIVTGLYNITLTGIPVFLDNRNVRLDGEPIPMDILRTKNGLAGRLNPDRRYTLYRLRNVSAYDGDTVKGDIWVGGILSIPAQSIRLLGIDTPEVRGSERPEGLLARDALRELLADSADVFVQVSGIREKYGRTLGTIWCTHEGRLIDVNQWLLASGHAQEFMV